MRVAVVTPYWKESVEVLKRCHDSVLAQTHPDTIHVMVSDGLPSPEVDSWSRVHHIKVPHHGDSGDTLRVIGALSASVFGAEAITLLDADNWFEPDHIETLRNVHLATGAQVVTGTRILRRMDGSVLGICHESNGRDFNDTNCYFLTKPTFGALISWGFKDPRESIMGDRIFWQALLRHGYSRAHCLKPTTNYVTSFAAHYLAFGEEAPDQAKIIVKFADQEHSRMMLYKDFLRLSQGS
jgi:glycosyltransferase involved in cell wall biosynthesis